MAGAREPRDARLDQDDAGDDWATEILMRAATGSIAGHVYTTLAGELRSFTKYSPDALLAVGSEPIGALLRQSARSIAHACTGAGVETRDE